MERPEFKNRREKLEWYLDEIDCYKEDMGKWYTVFIRRILPFLLFAIPINIIAKQTYQFIADKYLGGILSSMDLSYLPVLWSVSLVIFLIILIFFPRFATFCEFVLGGMYIVLAFKLGLMNTGLGYFTIISLSLFVFMKFVFLIIEIMYLIVFRHDKPSKAYVDDTDVVF